MAALVKLGLAIAAGLFVGSKAVENVGEGVDQAGSGALKLAIAAGVGTAAWLALRRFG